MKFNKLFKVIQQGFSLSRCIKKLNKMKEKKKQYFFCLIHFSNVLT